MYLFDALPVHPLPLPLESFTGYLVRLAEANQITSISGLSAMAFPHLQRRGVWTDYPRLTYGDLQVATTCSIEQLHATTFYHLARKFRRSLYAGPLSTFLTNSVSPTLRYCPRCLVEHGYYSLVWRYLAVTGCPEHHLWLLDHCTHCGSVVPLVPSPLRVGLCPTCGQNLRECSSSQLDTTEHQQATVRFQDLAFLLSPQPWEAADKVGQALGPYLSHVRQDQGWNIESMNEYLGGSEIRRGVESKSSVGRGETFQHYLDYFDRLGLSFRDAFAAVCYEVDHAPSRADQLMNAARQAVTTLQAQQRPLTKQAICELIGQKDKTLRRFPEVWTMLEEAIANDKIRIRQQRFAQAQEIAARLQATGQRPSWKTVCAELGFEPAALRLIPEIRAVLEPLLQVPVIDESTCQQVQQTITQLQADDLPVSPAIVAQVVGVSLHRLKRHPLIQPLLAPLSTTPPRRYPPDHLLPLVEQAVHSLEQAGEVITQHAIARHMEISVSTLVRYPAVHACVQAACERDVIRRQQQRVAAMIERVQQAIAHLQQTGQPVLYQTVADHLELSTSTLSHYESVCALLDPFSQQHLATRHNALYAQVEQAIEQLQAQNQRVTLGTVAQLIGTSPERLRFHPAIVTCVSAFAESNAALAAQQRQIKEDRLREEVIQAIQHLRDTNQRVTQVAVARALNTDTQRLKFYPSIRPLLAGLVKPKE